MDFELAFFISTHITSVIIAIALMVYIYSVRKVISDVKRHTAHALVFLSVAGLAMIPISLTDFYFTDTLWLWAGLFFGFLALALQSIFYSEEKSGTKFKVVAAGILLFVIVMSLLRITVFPWLPLYFEIVGIMILMGSSLIYSGILLKETPTTFTVSLFILQIAFILSWGLWLTKFIPENPAYFIIQAIPMLVAAAIFSSVSRQWRTLVTSFLVAAMVNLGISLSWSSYISGEFLIYQFVIVAVIAGLSVMVPLNYFLQQSSDSRARTPLYMGMVLIALAGLVINHSTSWAIYITQGGIWNEYLTFIDLVLGAIAINSFLLAGASAGFSSATYNKIRDIVLVMTSAIIALGVPYVRIVEETGVMRWKVAALYPVLLISIAVGVLFFIRVSLKIHRRGATRAAQTFMLFIMSSLSLGLVVMFSDIFLSANIFGLNLILLLIAATLALVSSPPVLARLTRGRNS